MAPDTNPSNRLPLLLPRPMESDKSINSTQPFPSFRPTIMPTYSKLIHQSVQNKLPLQIYPNESTNGTHIFNPSFFGSPAISFPAPPTGLPPRLVPYLHQNISEAYPVYHAANRFLDIPPPPFYQGHLGGPIGINGYNPTFAAQDVLASSGGSFQELLRSVSMPSNNHPPWQNIASCSNQPARPAEENNACKEVGKTQTDNNPQDLTSEKSSNLETEVDNTEEEEEDYHAVDDDNPDCLADDEADKVVVPDMDVVMRNPDQHLEFEFVDLDNEMRKVGKKRRRFPKGYEVPDFRKAKEIGAIETAMKRARQVKVDFVFEPKLAMVFDSRAEVYQFYNFYSWELGFGVRYGGFARNRVNKMRTMQELVCEREGFDPRCKQSSKRIRCKAMIRLHRTEDLGWYISKIVTEHNHELSVSCGEKREWNSHSKIEACTKNMIRCLRENNVSVTRVHCLMGDFYGKMNAIPFNNKSIRAVCSEIARDQKQDDIAKTFEVFRQMFADDPGFQFSVDLDEDKKVKSILWTCGRSRMQYNYFGDAITFDTTYCTNIYNMPFGMFVGVNNHFQSVLFAGVLMIREDAKSFEWVFNEFLTLMGGKAPVTIFTDQCKAMTKAIKIVFPSWTVHLWCKWHVLHHAPELLGPVYKKKGPFRRDFHFIINQMLTTDEFERAWEHLIVTYGLKNNDFMKRTYEKRKKWAKPWAKDTFCARMATTQRSESANSILKKVIPRNSTMNRFVQQYDKLLFLRASAEEKAEHQTKQFVHRAKRLYAIEKHAISVYTRNTFELFSEEVDKATEYVVEATDVENTYLVIHNNADTRKHWARVIFRVEVKDNGLKYCCECGQYEHFGMLCCHCLKVMMDKGIKEIPEPHIMKRWTRNARDKAYPEIVCTSPGEQLGRAILYAHALDVVNLTAKDPHAEEILTRHLSKAREEIELMRSQKNNLSITEKGKATTGYMSETPTDTEYADTTDYDSERPSVRKNGYGAAGSSAYMSDADVNNIKAPTIEVKVGRRRENRIKGMFERKRKGWKRYRAEETVVEEEGTAVKLPPPTKKKRGKK